MNITIQPDIQEAIITMLPDPEEEAIEIICQITANLILSMENQSKEKVFKLIEKNIIAYKGN